MVAIIIIGAVIRILSLGLTLFTEGYHPHQQPVCSLESGPPFSDCYQPPPSGSSHQRRGSTPSDYSSHEGVRGRELEAQASDPKDFLQDSGGYVPDSAESGSTDADNYDTMQVPRECKGHCEGAKGIVRVQRVGCEN